MPTAGEVDQGLHGQKHSTLAGNITATPKKRYFLLSHVLRHSQHSLLTTGLIRRLIHRSLVRQVLNSGYIFSAHMTPEMRRQLNVRAILLKDEVGVLTQVQRAQSCGVASQFPVRLTSFLKITCHEMAYEYHQTLMIIHVCLLDVPSSSVYFAGELRWAADCLRE